MSGRFLPIKNQPTLPHNTPVPLLQTIHSPGYVVSSQKIPKKISKKTHPMARSPTAMLGAPNIALVPMEPQLPETSVLVAHLLQLVLHEAKEDKRSKHAVFLSSVFLGDQTCLKKKTKTVDFSRLTRPSFEKKCLRTVDLSCSCLEDVPGIQLATFKAFQVMQGGLQLLPLDSHRNSFTENDERKNQRKCTVLIPQKQVLSAFIRTCKPFKSFFSKTK